MEFVIVVLKGVAAVGVLFKKTADGKKWGKRALTED